jgi:hypothetical protein
LLLCKLLLLLLLHQYLLLVHELLLMHIIVSVLVRCTMPYVRMPDLLKSLICRVQIVISAGIGRICRVDGVGCHIRAI